MELLTTLLILLVYVLYIATYVYSVKWFIRKNFLEDYRGETTLGSFIAYIVWSLFGPLICLVIFFDWFIKLDCWMWSIKDIKFRYILNYIPVIGIISIFVLVLKGHTKCDTDSNFDCEKYIFGGEKLAYIQIIWQIVGSVILEYFIFS